MSNPKSEKKLLLNKNAVIENSAVENLYHNISSLIFNARSNVAHAVNTQLVMRNWQIGHLINAEILKQTRGEYGKAVIKQLASQLTQQFGQGFTRASLFRMLQFANQFPDQQIVATMSRQLTWSHFVEIIAIDDPLKREFYAEMCRMEHWNVRLLRNKIQNMLFERTSLSKKPEALVRKELQQLRESDQLTPGLILQDPYCLEFLGLKDTYSESDLEQAILRELEKFLQELGSDFCFIARQKRMVIDNEDYYLDLLFFHRNLRRLIAIELKLGKFQAADKGQMELYLRWLDKYEKRPGEDKPLGIILCAEKKQEKIELLELDQSSIHVAQYLTELPAREVLANKLHQAIELARKKYHP